MKQFTIFTVFTLSVALLVWACATTPETNRRQLMLVPADQMQQLGEESYEMMKKETKMLANSTLVSKIKEVGRNITAIVPQNYAWEISVFDSDQVNAFCLPGGKIGVYRGLLQTAHTNAQIAAIIGHEIAHATARHGAERMSQELMAQGTLALASVSLSDHKYNNIILSSLGIGINFGLLLPYSRRHESEADHIGTLYMAEAGYDPTAAIKVWENMAAMNKKSPPEFLSTHPNPSSRIEYLKKNMDLYSRRYESAVKTHPTENLTQTVSH
jgi:predicted Zn-dependent protease